MADTRMMTVLIVVESWFGNTRTVAQAVGDGLRRSAAAEVVLRAAAEAPSEIPAEVGLLLVGAPTHEFSLPKPQTRQQAVAKGAAPHDGIGLREWIEHVSPRPDLRALSFDTSYRSRFALGFAAKTAAKALRKRGFERAERGPSFWVTGVSGPLADGELDRATRWGVDLTAAAG